MNILVVRRVVTAAIAVGAASAVMRQCRKPAGWLGRRLAAAMNIGHRGLTVWGLEPVMMDPHWRVLDIGCGGGRTIRTLAEKTTTGRVEGVDYSSASVAVARRTNAQLIETGRVDVCQASVSHLPFADRSFDLVTAVETHYYWPDLSRDLREVLRVLKPGGRFVMVAETYRGRRNDWFYRPIMRLVLGATYLTLDEHRDALQNAGFADAEVRAERSRGWMCAAGRRPE